MLYSFYLFGDYRLRGDSLRIVANNVSKIKHWNIINGDCFEYENRLVLGLLTRLINLADINISLEINLDYLKLSIWCKNRNGQVIVCENTKSGLDAL